MIVLHRDTHIYYILYLGLDKNNKSKIKRRRNFVVKSIEIVFDDDPFLFHIYFILYLFLFYLQCLTTHTFKILFSLAINACGRFLICIILLFVYQVTSKVSQDLRKRNLIQIVYITDVIEALNMMMFPIHSKGWIILYLVIYEILKTCSDTIEKLSKPFCQSN